MTRRILAIASVLVASVVCLSADDMNVQVDPHANFASFRTFSIRKTSVDSPRPELDNSLFVKRMSTTIRAALVAQGLKDVADKPDLYVDFTLAGEDVSTTQRGAIRGAGPQPLMYTQATLVIDLFRPGETSQVWRGTYRDDEKTGSKLMAKLPEDAKKLIAKYPKR